MNIKDGESSLEPSLERMKPAGSGAGSEARPGKVQVIPLRSRKDNEADSQERKLREAFNLIELNS